MGVEIQVGGAWKEASDRTPVGLISAFGGTVAPDGWFLCNGSAISRATYPDLYAVIGISFGAGDGVSTFNLPNLQGVGLTGAGVQNINGRAKSGPTLGSTREDQLQGHWHNLIHPNAGGSHMRMGVESNAINSDTFTDDLALKDATARSPVTDGTNDLPRVGAYTHGPEVGVNFIIKY